MDTKALRYFQAVAEFGSYSRGAEFLRLSQPALSRQIKRLEDELGTALFIRHGHGVTLTEAGRMLLARSQVILRQIDQARAEIREGGSGPAGVVTLAVPPAAGTYPDSRPRRTLRRVVSERVPESGRRLQRLHP